MSSTFGIPDVHLGGPLGPHLAKSDTPPDDGDNRQVQFYASVLVQMSQTPVYAEADLIGGCFVPPGVKPIYHIDNFTGERVGR